MRNRSGQEWGFLPSALAISVVVHALLLSSGIVRLPATPAAGVPVPLVAHLPQLSPQFPVVSPTASPADDDSAPPTVQEPVPQVPVRREEPRGRTLSPRSPTVAAEPARPIVEPKAAQEQAALPPSGAPAGEPRPGGAPVLDNGAPATPAAAMPTPPEGPDSNALREYRWALVGKAGRPELDLPPGEKGLRGQVDIRVTVRPLKIPQVEVARSSGVPVLDEEALRVMRRAAERARVPKSLQSSPFSVELPVRFGPEER